MTSPPSCRIAGHTTWTNHPTCGTPNNTYSTLHLRWSTWQPMLLTWKVYRGRRNCCKFSCCNIPTVPVNPEIYQILDCNTANFLDNFIKSTRTIKISQFIKTWTLFGYWFKLLRPYVPKISHSFRHTLLDRLNSGKFQTWAILLDIFNYEVRDIAGGDRLPAGFTPYLSTLLSETGTNAAPSKYTWIGNKIPSSRDAKVEITWTAFHVILTLSLQYSGE